jgi:hypothetical protein
VVTGGKAARSGQDIIIYRERCAHSILPLYHTSYIKHQFMAIISFGPEIAWRRTFFTAHYAHDKTGGEYGRF